MVKIICMKVTNNEKEESNNGENRKVCFTQVDLQFYLNLRIEVLNMTNLLHPIQILSFPFV
jgi:hypothetical protein